MNLNVCEEHKTEREAIDENVPAKRADFLIGESVKKQITDSISTNLTD